MPRLPFRRLPATLSALLFATSAAHAEPPPAAPAAAPAAHAQVPPPQQVQPSEAPTPSLEEIARAFDPSPGGLTSDEIVKLALAHSPALRKAELSEDTAKSNKARAKIAFAPRFDFMGKYTHLSQLNFTSPFAKSGAAPPTVATDTPEEARSREIAQEEVKRAFSALNFRQRLDQGYLTAGAVMPVTDIFLTVIPQYKGVARLADVAMKQREASELQVAFDARTAFYNYAHVIGVVIIAQRAVELYEANVHDLEALVSAGTATETDLMRARSALAKARVEEVQYTGMEEVALRRLAVITGTEMDAKRGIGERFVGIELGATPEVDKITEEAKRVRPELNALRKLEEARQHLASSKRGAQLPKLNAFGNLYYANPHPRIIPQQNQWNNSWDVGVSLSYSPNDSIFAHTQYKDALTELALVREDLRLVEDGIEMEAAQAVTMHRTAVASTNAAGQSLEASRRYQGDQRSLLLAGAATPNDVLEAQLLLTRAALEWVGAYIDVRLAEAALLKTRGQTLSSAQGPTVSRSTP